MKNIIKITKLSVLGLGLAYEHRALTDHPLGAHHYADGLAQALDDVIISAS